MTTEREALAEAREAFEKMLSAAEGLSRGIDWNKGTHALTHGYRRKLIAAIAPARAALAKIDAAQAAVSPTEAQIARHTIRAGDCPPDSQVLLVSSVQRLQAKQVAAAQAAAPVAWQIRTQLGGREWSQWRECADRELSAPPEEVSGPLKMQFRALYAAAHPTPQEPTAQASPAVPVAIHGIKPSSITLYNGSTDEPYIDIDGSDLWCNAEDFREEDRDKIRWMVNAAKAVLEQEPTAQASPAQAVPDGTKK